MLRCSSKLQHVNQTRQAAASTLQEITSENFTGRGAVLDIDGEALTQEDFELSAQLVRVLERRGSVRGDEPEGFEGFFVEVRGFGFDHFDGHDAEGPHVDFAAVFFLFDDLGGHPVGCAHHGGTLGFLIGEFGAETEVGCNEILVSRIK